MPYLNKAPKAKSRTFKREDRQKIYQSAKWKKLRAAKLLDLPLCEMCLANGKTTTAVDVHHIDSFMNYSGNERLYKAYDYNNLMSICKECHSKIHSNGKTKFIPYNSKI